jgi:ParB family chromosome partitioning protein
MKIKLCLIAPNPRQPRRHFEKRKLAELAASMANEEVGLIHPVVVERGDGEQEGQFILVDGERRVRAARMLEWDEIEAVVREATNHNGRDRLIHAIVANEQRADMNSMERARAYKEMLDELGSIADVVRYVGKSDATVRNYLALLEFEPQIQMLFERGLILATGGVIAALKRLDAEKRLALATSAAIRGVSEQVFIRVCRKYELSLPRRRGPRKIVDAAPVKSGEHFSALNFVANRMLPDNIVEPATMTCEACDLYDFASLQTCRQCPLVDFLRRF